LYTLSLHDALPIWDGSVTRVPGEPERTGTGGGELPRPAPCIDRPAHHPRGRHAGVVGTELAQPGRSAQESALGQGSGARARTRSGRPAATRPGALLVPTDLAAPRPFPPTP